MREKLCSAQTPCLHPAHKALHRQSPFVPAAFQASAFRCRTGPGEAYIGWFGFGAHRAFAVLKPDLLCSSRAKNTKAFVRQRAVLINPSTKSAPVLLINSIGKRCRSRGVWLERLGLLLQDPSCSLAGSGTAQSCAPFWPLGIPECLFSKNEPC